MLTFRSPLSMMCLHMSGRAHGASNFGDPTIARSTKACRQQRADKCVPTKTRRQLRVDNCVRTTARSLGYGMEHRLDIFHTHVKFSAVVDITPFNLQLRAIIRISTNLSNTFSPNRTTQNSKLQDSLLAIKHLSAVRTSTFKLHDVLQLCCLHTVTPLLRYLRGVASCTQHRTLGSGGRERLIF